MLRALNSHSHGRPRDTWVHGAAKTYEFGIKLAAGDLHDKAGVICKNPHFAWSTSERLRYAPKNTLGRDPSERLVEVHDRGVIRYIELRSIAAHEFDFAGLSNPGQTQILLGVAVKYVGEFYTDNAPKRDNERRQSPRDPGLNRNR